MTPASTAMRRAGSGTDSDPEMQHPGHVYYRACHGQWRCRLDMRITDAAALRESNMGRLDRLALLAIAMWPAWLGRFYLTTSVRYDGTAEVVHTTEVRWLGIPMMKSVETIRLDDDGPCFTMHGTQRVGPAFWRARTLSGTGRVDDDATGASYRFAWLGVELEQSTTRTENQVALRQRGPGFEGEQVLLRRESAS